MIPCGKEKEILMMKKVFVLLLAAVMVMALFAGCGTKKNYAENNTEFVIGVSGPLTGGAAKYGVAVKNSAQMAVDEINEAGGLDGIQFELVMYDDKHDATTVETLYAKLYEEGMQASLGTVTTKPGLEFKTFAKDDNVFFITPSATGTGSVVEVLTNGAPIYSYGLAVPIPGVILVLFHKPPPLYISQVKRPGISDAGAIVHGISCLFDSVARAEIT